MPVGELWLLAAGQRRPRHAIIPSFLPWNAAPQGPAGDVAGVHAAQYGDGPLLPLAVPVERDGHGAEPGAQHGAERAAVRLVERGGETGAEGPGRRVDAERVEEREEREDGQVGGAQGRVSGLRQERCPQEDEGDVQSRHGEGREYRREERGL